MKKRIKWWTIWMGLGCLPIFYLFVYFGYEDRGFAALMFTLSVSFALAANWKSNGHVLFWIAAVLLVAIHIALVLLLPWPTWKLSGAAFMEIFTFPDFLVNYAVIRLFLMGINRRGREADFVGEMADLRKRPPR